MSREPGRMQKGEGFQIYQGAAPTPVRSVSVGDQSSDVLTITDTAQLTNIGPPDLSAPPPLPRGMRSAPPPENPDLMQTLNELSAKVGQLTDTVGKQRAEYEARLEEQALNHQLQLLAMRGPLVPTLPADVNPDQQITVKDLTTILTRYGNDMQTALTRQGWDVTPDEEMAVLQANPAFAQVPEPERTIFIKKAVDIRRRTLGKTNGAAAPTTNPSTPAHGSAAAPASPAPRQIQGHMVPTPELSAPGDVGDIQPQSVHQQAVLEYREADKIQNRTARLAAKKQAMKKAQYALGISDEAMAAQPFSQRS